MFGLLFYFGAIVTLEKSTLYRGGLLGCYLVADYRIWKTERLGEISTAFFSSIESGIFVIIVSVANSTLFNARAYSSHHLHRERICRV